jgi:hypothetical protein
MQKYKTLSSLPVQINETGYKQILPKTLALELLEKLQDRDYAIAHLDQSKSLVDNIKNMITIISDNRIQFD